jgi:hypothetical protein
MLVAIHHPDKVWKWVLAGANVWLDSRTYSPDMMEIPDMLPDSLSGLNWT